MPKIKLFLLAMAATALIAGAGCGGDDDGGNGGGEELSKQDYAAEIRDVLEPLGTELTQIGDVIGESANPDQLADSVESAEDEIQSAIDGLREINPPSEVAGAHDLVVSALGAFNDALNALSDAAQSGEVASIVSAARQLPGEIAEVQKKLNDARQQLQDAGIEVGD